MMNTDTIIRSNSNDFSKYQGLEHELVTINVPAETNTYKPIGHKMIIDNVMNELEKRGLKVNSRRYITNKPRTQVLALYGIEGDNPSFGQQLAWRNSYDKSMSVGFVSGVNVWVCSNSCISGDVIFNKKHVSDVRDQLTTAIEEQIDLMQPKYDRMLKDFEMMKHVPLSFKEMAEVCGRMFVEERIITPNQLSKLRSEMTNPTFDYSDKKYSWKNNDAYSLYQHATYVLKDSHPYLNVKQLDKLHSFFMSKVAKN